MTTRSRRKSAVAGAMVVAELLLNAAGVHALTYHTRGYSKTGSALDGTKALLRWEQMSNNAGCSIVSTTISSPGRQLQAGLAQCAQNWAITSPACAGAPFRFTERYDGAYQCFRFGGASVSTNYSAQVSRTSAGTYQSYWGGTPHVSQAGFGAATAFTWGEQFGDAANCDNSWKTNAVVSSWQVRNENVWVTGTAVPYLGSNHDCWVVSNVSNGGYTIAHL